MYSRRETTESHILSLLPPKRRQIYSGKVQTCWRKEKESISIFNKKLRVVGLANQFLREWGGWGHGGHLAKFSDEQPQNCFLLPALMCFCLIVFVHFKNTRNGWAEKYVAQVGLRVYRLLATSLVRLCLQTYKMSLFNLTACYHLLVINCY